MAIVRPPGQVAKFQRDNAWREKVQYLKTRQREKGHYEAKAAPNQVFFERHIDNASEPWADLAQMLSVQAYILRNALVDNAGERALSPADDRTLFFTTAIRPIYNLCEQVRDRSGIRQGPCFRQWGSN